MKIKKKTLILLTLIILILIGAVVFLLKFGLALYYRPVVNEFVNQNLKSEHRNSKTSLFPIYSEYGAPKALIWLRLYNWYNLDWEKDDIQFKVLYKPNLDIILAIEDKEIYQVDINSAQDKAAKYLLLPEKLDFECNFGVCIATWENKYLAVGKIEGQDITIVLAQEIK
ncbi:hypothetical protein AMJ50_00775 [Parcubacteria bacterium DG_74_3]|nr:MAG: hypothetical protein AMJ50_00775 [Parcubacteria bacterium DG_74_3]